MAQPPWGTRMSTLPVHEARPAAPQVPDRHHRGVPSGRAGDAAGVPAVALRFKKEWIAPEDRAELAEDRGGRPPDVQPLDPEPAVPDRPVADRPLDHLDGGIRQE